jgi:hypothetical protein
MAIPSQAEMAAEGYAYHPCPLRPPPIPANTFLRHLSNPGPHKNLLWGNRIPQKLHRSILQIQAPDNLVIGWGVHVIEGLNKFAVRPGRVVGERYCSSGMGGCERRRPGRVWYRSVADKCGSYCGDAGCHEVDRIMSANY